MSDVKYTYAVARIRAMEMSLFNSAMIEQLLAMKDYDACLQFLAEKGWGDPESVPQFKGGHQGERHRKELRKGLL